MAPGTKRKRMKLREGDVLELTLPDGRLRYGVIIDRGVLSSGGTPYIAVFGSAFAKRPEASQLASEGVALAGWTTDALVYHDKWKVIANDLPLPALPMPNFKVGQGGDVFVTDYRGKFIDHATARERELLDFQFSVTAAIFQDAFEALHGFGEWKQYYDELTPAHARARITRPNLQRGKCPQWVESGHSDTCDTRYAGARKPADESVLSFSYLGWWSRGGRLFVPQAPDILNLSPPATVVTVTLFRSNSQQMRTHLEEFS